VVRNMVRVIIVLLLSILFLVQPLGAVFASGSDYLSVLAEDQEPVTLEDFETWAANLMISVIRFLQNISPIFVLLVIFIGAGIFIVGGVFGSRSLRGTGASCILAAIFAFIIMRNAPAIVLMIENLVVR